MAVAHFRHRCAFAAAHAGCTENANFAFLQPLAEGLIERLGAGHFAGEGVAYADRHRRRRGLIVAQHIEMRIEGSDLIDLGQRQLHLMRQRHQMRGG